MRILLIGGGGREHALCSKLAQSPRVRRIFVAPGNPGTATVEKAQNVPIPATALDALVAFASSEGVDLTIVGPEQPLAEGLVDRMQARRLTVFGPTKAAAQIEASKQFAKDLMKEAGVPTAAYEVCKTSEEALSCMERSTFPIVLKADGLAAGKGVAICHDKLTARAFIHDVMQTKTLGDAGGTMVIEEFLEGEEVSFFVLASGTEFVPLTSAQDHKRLLDGDQGPNTGGMGAYSPAPIFTPDLQDLVCKTVITPVLQTMSNRGTPFSGLLYAGLMLTKDGPKVLEFNARFGDPETQVILPRLTSDLAELLDATARGRLRSTRVDWSAEHAMTVVLAAAGYPASPRKGDVISGIAEASEQAMIFHAGTKVEGGKLVTSGGRVLCVTTLGGTLEAASAKAYQAVQQIQFSGKQFRTDIGARALRQS